MKPLGKPPAGIRFPTAVQAHLDALRPTTVRADLTLQMLVRATLEAFVEMEERHHAEAEAASLSAEIETEKKALPTPARKRL